MKAKNLFISAAVIGSVCAARAGYVSYEIFSNREAYGLAVAGGAITDQVFWWPFFGTVAFLSCGGLAYLFHRRHDGDAV